DGVHDGAGEAPVFRVEAVGEKPELGDGVQRRYYRGAVVATLLHVAPVHQKGVGGFTLPVDGYVAGLQGTGTRPIGRVSPSRGLVGTDGYDACLQPKQVKVAAAVEGQVRHLFVFDDVAELGAGGFNLRRLSGNFDGLSGSPHLQTEVRVVT